MPEADVIQETTEQLEPEETETEATETTEGTETETETTETEEVAEEKTEETTPAIPFKRFKEVYSKEKRAEETLKAIQADPFSLIDSSPELQRKAMERYGRGGTPAPEKQGGILANLSPAIVQELEQLKATDYDAYVDRRAELIADAKLQRVMDARTEQDKARTYYENDVSSFRAHLGKEVSPDEFSEVLPIVREWCGKNQVYNLTYGYMIMSALAGKGRPESIEAAEKVKQALLAPKTSRLKTGGGSPAKAKGIKSMDPDDYSDEEWSKLDPKVKAKIMAG